MQNKPFGAWAQAAVKEMRFLPDRDTVRQELEAHMEDRRADFLAQDLPEVAAEAAVLQVMGSAAETGKLLNKAHSPWLGYAWLLSKYLCGLAVAACICALLFGSGSFRLQNSLENAWMDHPCEYLDSICPFQAVDADLALKAGDYTLELHHGGVKEEGLWCRAVLAWRVWSWKPWRLYPQGLENLQVEDSFGGVWTVNSSMEEGQPTVLLNVNGGAQSILPVWNVHICLDYMPWEEGALPEWLRFSVPGTELAFTVWMDGEVRSA